MLPMEDSICVSYGTDEVGRRGRGRAYQPPGSVSCLDSHGFITGTICDAIRDQQVDLLENMSQSPTGPAGWRVWPAVIPRPPTRYGVITSVRVGNVMDRQKSRREGIPEIYNTPAAIVH